MPNEQLAPKPQCDFDILVVCGPSGVGKTTVANQLAELLQLPSPLKMGDHIRRFAKRQQQEEIMGAMEREDAVDVRVDTLLGKIIRRHMRECSMPLIIEARRAALVAQTEQDRAQAEKTKVPKVVTVFLNADPAIRYRRIHKRQPDYSLKEVAKKTKAREEYDLAKWRRLAATYPGMRYDIDPFDESAIAYDIIVHTDSMNVEAVLADILGNLAEKHLYHPAN